MKSFIFGEISIKFWDISIYKYIMMSWLIGEIIHVKVNAKRAIDRVVACAMLWRTQPVIWVTPHLILPVNHQRVWAMFTVDATAVRRQKRSRKILRYAIAQMTALMASNDWQDGSPLADHRPLAGQAALRRSHERIRNAIKKRTCKARRPLCG